MVKGEDSLGRGARIRVWDVDVKTQPRETRHASSCCGGRRGRGHLVEVTISPGGVFCLGAQLAGTDSLHAFRPPRRRIRRGRCTIRRGFSLHRRSIHHIWRRTQVEVVELAQLLCSRSFGTCTTGMSSGDGAAAPEAGTADSALTALRFISECSSREPGAVGSASTTSAGLTFRPNET